jgi:hypothetical protein
MKKKAKSGDYFLVPATAPRKYVGRIVANVDELNAVLCQFLDIESVESCNDLATMRLEDASILAERFVTKELLARGDWEICQSVASASELTSVQLRELEKGRYMGTTIFGAGLVAEFFDTFYGVKRLDTWALPEYVAKFFSESSWSRRRPTKDA